MSATAVDQEVVERSFASQREPARSHTVGDRTVLALLSLAFLVFVALTWRKWGMPEGDAGAELTTADLIKHGAVAYRDVRYFYGPVGLYGLALSFKLFGTSLTTAYAFGLVQALAILGTFYALARNWLAPIAAGLTTAVLLPIGFSGTAFNFVLPHTNSATFGLLALLLMLLMLTRGRLLPAGVALGIVGLTRPEFLAVASGAGAAYVIASWRMAGRPQAAGALWRLMLPGVVIPAAVLGWFATKAGLSNLLTQNLWPADFLRISGFRMQQNWTPLDIPSLFGLLARGGLYMGALGALLLCAERLASSRDAAAISLARLRALLPLAWFVGTAGIIDIALRVSVVFASQRHAIEGEVHHLILGMSWLPCLGLVVAAWAALRLVQRRDAPLGGNWPVDFALIVAAAGLGLRAYNAFTAEGSYAPYYAAPLVLLLGILHVRIAARRPQSAFVMLGSLGLVAGGLAAYSIFGLYRHLDALVHTPRGTFVTVSAAAGPLQRVIREIDADTSPNQPILAAPVDGGLYFFADRRPALYELSLLPGLLPSRASQESAIVRMGRERMPLAVLSSRDNSRWATSAFGVGYDALVGNYLRRSALSSSVVGTLAHPVAGTFPAHGFTVVRLSTSTCARRSAVGSPGLACRPR